MFLLWGMLKLYTAYWHPVTPSSSGGLWPYSSPAYDHEPEFPGGIPAIKDFLKDNIVYPPEAIAQNIYGKVFVKFKVEKDGSVKNATILESKHPLLDSEALRVIRLMHKWKPGTLKGDPVPVYMMQPVNFRLPSHSTQ